MTIPNNFKIFLILNFSIGQFTLILKIIVKCFLLNVIFSILLVRQRQLMQIQSPLKLFNQY